MTLIIIKYVVWFFKRSDMQSNYSSSLKEKRNALFKTLDVYHSYVRLQCTIFKMHEVHSVCFVIADLRSLTLLHALNTHVLQMSCM